MRVFLGSIRDVDPVRNDVDPDGDDLDFCSFDNQQQGDVSFFTEEGSDDGPAVFAGPNARLGPYVFSYDVCDETHVTSGTITVIVERKPRIKAATYPARPGLVRFTNPADFAVTVTCSTNFAGPVDAEVRVPAGASRTVRVHQRKVLWIARNQRKGFDTFGRVTVRLPRA